MSSVITDNPLVSGIPLGGVMTIPLFQTTLPISLIISTPNSYYKLEAVLIDDPIVEPDSFIAEFAVDTGVNFILNLIGKRIEDGTKFRSGHFYLDFKVTEPSPRAHFIAATLMAACGLAGKLEVPELVATPLSFNLPLLEISKILQRRQIAYRLMIIERAMGKKFSLPPVITGSQVETIAFIYHSLVDRSFIWSSGMFEVTVYATQEWSDKFAQHIEPSDIAHNIGLVSESILGQSISLGHATVIIKDAIIQHLDKVRQELSYLDGRPIKITIQSLSGQVEYEFSDAPRATDALWDSKIQALVNMESQLDAAIIERYHALAASTLEGLSVEDKAVITTRPELDQRAFLE